LAGILVAQGHPPNACRLLTPQELVMPTVKHPEVKFRPLAEALLSRM
jgi:hypothetical protein